MKLIATGNNLCRIMVSDEYTELANILYELVERDKKYDKVVIITDKNVEVNLYDNFVKLIFSMTNEKYFSKICIEPGEESKCLDTFNKIISEFIEIGVTRKSLVIAFGGGVVGDLAGFVAATYMRGIDYIQVPTTVLSQVDSAIGGKTGIDVGVYKNMIGAFKQPLFTYINTETLKTLPKDELKSGFGEVIKYAAIMDDDGEFEKFLYENADEVKCLDNEKIINAIVKCAEFKARVVKADEKETGLRKILNFGHTFGHAIEMEYELKHGEAVAIGMKIAFKLALSKGYIKKDYYDNFVGLIDKYDFEFDFETVVVKRLVEVIKKDKKNSFGDISVILPDASSCVGIFKMTSDEIEELLKKEFNFM